MQCEVFRPITGDRLGLNSGAKHRSRYLDFSKDGGDISQCEVFRLTPGITGDGIDLNSGAKHQSTWTSQTLSQRWGRYWFKFRSKTPKYLDFSKMRKSLKWHQSVWGVQAHTCDRPISNISTTPTEVYLTVVHTVHRSVSHLSAHCTYTEVYLTVVHTVRVHRSADHLCCKTSLPRLLY